MTDENTPQQDLDLTQPPPGTRPRVFVGSVDENGVVTPPPATGEATAKASTAIIRADKPAAKLVGTIDDTAGTFTGADGEMVSLEGMESHRTPMVSVAPPRSSFKLPSWTQLRARVSSLPDFLKRKPDTPKTPGTDLIVAPQGDENSVTQGGGRHLPAIIPSLKFSMPAVLTGEGAPAKAFGRAVARAAEIGGNARKALDANVARFSPTEEARSARENQQIIALSNGKDLADEKIKGIAKEGMATLETGRKSFNRLEAMLADAKLQPQNLDTALQGISELGTKWPELSKSALKILGEKSAALTEDAALSTAATRIIAITQRQRPVAETEGVKLLADMLPQLTGDTFGKTVKVIAQSASGVRANIPVAFAVLKNVIENNLADAAGSPASTEMALSGMLQAMRSAPDVNMAEGLKVVHAGILENKFGNSTDAAMMFITDRAYTAPVQRAPMKLRGAAAAKQTPGQPKENSAAGQAREIVTDLLLRSETVRTAHSGRVFAAIAASNPDSPMQAADEILSMYDKLKDFNDPAVRSAASDALLPVAQEIATNLGNLRSVSERSAFMAMMQRIDNSTLLTGKLKGQLTSLFASAEMVDIAENAYLDAISGYAEEAGKLFKAEEPAATPVDEPTTPGQ